MKGKKRKVGNHPEDRSMMKMRKILYKDIMQAKKKKVA